MSISKNMSKRQFVDSLLDRGRYWICIDYIPWDENPFVLYEMEILRAGKIKYGKRRAHEWRFNGMIYHRDVFNHIWQKMSGKMNWVGIYNPDSGTINRYATEPT